MLAETLAQFIISEISETIKDLNAPKHQGALIYTIC